MKSYEAWKQLVDAIIQRTIGVSADDLRDQPYMTWYRAHVPPITAARRAIKAGI